MFSKKTPRTGLQKVVVDARQRTKGKSRKLTQRHKLLICGVGLVILAPIITIGAISERREAADTAATAATSATQTPTAPPSASEPPPAADSSQSQDDEEPDETDETHLKFGQTAHFTSTAGDSNTPLEFTVSTPTRFKLSKDATLYDAKASTVVKGERQPTNVYFVVTVKNTSKDESWDANFVFSDVTGTGDDEVVSSVDDGDIEGLGYLQDGGDELRPGKSATVKDGFSVKSADSIQYELSVDGLAGYTFYFTR